MEKWVGIWLPFLTAAEAGLWLFWVIETKRGPEVIAVPRPSILIKNDRLHCATGPAVHWPSERYWFWRGMQVPQRIIERPEEITVAMIDHEGNAEMRRVMIERYRSGEEVHGAAAYLRDAGAEPLDHDERFGTLWLREMRDDEPILILEVVNRSPEPDGSFKRYWLRVHPELRPLPPGDWSADRKREWLERQKPQRMTAHAAAASLHGLRAEKYQPMVET